MGMWETRSGQNCYNHNILQRTRMLTENNLQKTERVEWKAKALSDIVHLIGH